MYILQDWHDGEWRDLITFYSREQAEFHANEAPEELRVVEQID